MTTQNKVSTHSLSYMPLETFGPRDTKVLRRPELCRNFPNQYLNITDVI